jgi:hypothetical protein
MLLSINKQVMSKPVYISPETAHNYLEIRDYISLANYLKNIFKVQRIQNGVPLQYEYSADALNVLLKILEKILGEQISKIHNDILKELFRSLRNYAINSEVQTFLINNEHFLDNVRIIFTHLQSQRTSDILQIVLQFLINLIVSNQSAVYKVSDIFFNLLCTLLKDKMNLYETTALIYNISLHKELVLDFDIYCCILGLYDLKNEIEFIHFLLEKFIAYDSFWNDYKKFNMHNRTTMLAIIRDKQLKGQNLHLSTKGLKTLTSQFVTSGEIIFQTISSNESNLEPYEVSQLLQVISSLCSNEDYLKILQTDKDLLINSGVLLINIHRLGKETENCFSPIQSLAEIREPNKNLHEHPAFGFKADLIRIIGNLCWKNKLMQDLTREAELIPVILDCCNMDARNPCILFLKCNLRNNTYIS